VFVTGKLFKPNIMQKSSLMGRFCKLRKKWSVVKTVPELKTLSRGQFVEQKAHA
jgi:hypothetical protein